MKTALYMRVSTLEQAQEGYSLLSQKRKLIAYCEAMGWTVSNIYADEGISGASISKRPSCSQMLVDIKKGMYENVLIVKVDRLCRNTKELLEIVEILQNYNVRLNAVDEKIDYTTYVGKMVLTMLGSFAEFERNRITQRFKEGRTQKVLQGIKSKTSTPLFGYNYENAYYSINYSEAKIVKKVFELALNNVSFHEIARIIGADPNYNTNNMVWSPDKVRRILRNPTYKGCTYNGYFRHDHTVNYDALIVKAVNVEQIISEEDWDTINAILKTRQNTRTRKFSLNDFTFGDVAYCGVCGKKMYAKNSKDRGNKRRYYYRCTNKGKNFNLDGAYQFCSVCCVENSTAEKLFLQYFEDVIIAPKKPDETVEDNNKKIIEIEKELKLLDYKKLSLSKKFIEDLITPDIYFSLNAEYNDQCKSLQNELELLKNEKSATVQDHDTLLNLKVPLRDLWAVMSKEEKRKFITVHFEKVYITKNGITNVEFRKTS